MGQTVPHSRRIYAVWTPTFTGVVTGFQTFQRHCKVGNTRRWKKNCTGRRFDTYEEAYQAIREKQQRRPAGRATAAAGAAQGRRGEQAAAAAGPAEKVREGRVQQHRPRPAGTAQGEPVAHTGVAPKEEIPAAGEQGGAPEEQGEEEQKREEEEPEAEWHEGLPCIIA